MGEGKAGDAEIMPLIDQCNIACGGHAGDEATMRKTVRLAIANQVQIGAHPGFPDKENFGRKPLKMDPYTLLASLKSQVESLKAICEEAGAKLHHIKPHGALYNLACIDTELARVTIRLMKLYPSAFLFAPWKSLMAKAAQKADVKIIHEAFADRKYQPNGRLAGRGEKGSVIADPDAAASQLLSIAGHNRALHIGGGAIEMRADTFCAHSDTPNVTEILKTLNGLKK